MEAEVLQAAKEMFRRLYLKSHSKRDYEGEDNNNNSDTNKCNHRDS